MDTLLPVRRRPAGDYLNDEHKYELDPNHDLELNIEPNFHPTFDANFDATFDTTFDAAFDTTFDATFDATFRPGFDPDFHPDFSNVFNTPFSPEFSIMPLVGDETNILGDAENGHATHSSLKRKREDKPMDRKLHSPKRVSSQDSLPQYDGNESSPTSPAQCPSNLPFCGGYVTVNCELDDQGRERTFADMATTSTSFPCFESPGSSKIIPARYQAFHDFIPVKPQPLKSKDGKEELDQANSLHKRSPSVEKVYGPREKVDRPRLTDGEKKHNHNVSETRRREALKSSYWRIAQLVPDMEELARSEARLLEGSWDDIVEVSEEGAMLCQFLASKAQDLDPDVVALYAHGSEALADEEPFQKFLEAPKREAIKKRGKTRFEQRYEANPEFKKRDEGFLHLSREAAAKVVKAEELAAEEKERLAAELHLGLPNVDGDLNFEDRKLTPSTANFSKQHGA